MTCLWRNGSELAYVQREDKVQKGEGCKDAAPNETIKVLWSNPLALNYPFHRTHSRR